MTVSLEKTTRPLIRFDDADVNRSTARSYAASLVSRVNKPETNEVLGLVAEGKRVDAYALAEALLDAQRHVATRFGQSMERRKYGERVAHLGYIAHAVLANHADGLPAMEPGARSRRVEELSVEVEHAGLVNQSLTADLTAEREARREAEQVALAAIRRAETAEGHVAALQAASATLDEVTADRDRIATVLDYTLGLLPPCIQQRVFGFWDAHQS